MSANSVWARLLPAFLLISLYDAAAQDRYAEIALRNSRPVPHHEAVVLPGSKKAQGVILFRIPNSLLVFVQEKGGFLAEPEVTIELYRGETKLDERIWRGETHASTFPATNDNALDVEGRVRFLLEPGTYAYTFSLGGASADLRRHRFEVPRFNDGEIAMPFFARRVPRSNGGIEVEPINLSGHAPFGGEAVALVPLPAAARDAGSRLDYRLYRISDANAPPVERPRRPRAGEEDVYELQPGDQLLTSGSADSGDAVPAGDVGEECLCWTPDGDGVLAPLPLNTADLENGVYILDVVLKTNGSEVKQRKHFRTFWRDMPLSLFDHEIAIRNLSFIESRETIRSMLRGSREQQIEAFRAYWKVRDPSPYTVVNELMEEYYRRIDHAASEFRTGRTPYPDGLRTDPARIYIVHGPPQNVSDSFPSSGGVEQVWTYPDGKRFVFWAASSLEPLELVDS